MAELQLRGISKSFGVVPVIHNVDLDIADGEFVVFVGPSGCGKSTLLRTISGLEEPSSGQVLIGGEDVTDFDPSERGVAMVFQSYALYPHMTVEENLGFGLRMGGMPKNDVAVRVADAARCLNLRRSSTASLANCQAASASASPSGGPLCANPRHSCLTSLFPTLMPNCGSRCGSRLPSSTRNLGNNGVRHP